MESTRKEEGHTFRTPNLVGMIVDGQPIPLQVIPPLNSQLAEILRLPWKENTEIEEPNPENMKSVQPEHSGSSGRMNMHVPSIESNTGKDSNSVVNFVERVESTKTLINPTGSGKEGINVDSPPLYGENVEEDKKGCDSEKLVGDGKGITPSVKDTSGEMSYKPARTHSSTEPTMAEVLAGLTNVGLMAEKGVFAIASRRRTRSCDAALEKKKTALGLGGDADNFMEPSEAVDLEEMERNGEEKKKILKGKGKAKRPSDGHTGGVVLKKRKGVVIYEPKSPVRGDIFVVDDVAESDEEGTAKALRESSKSKMKINDNRNRINNRRIAKDVEDVPTDGVEFCFEEHEVREFVCNVSEEIVDPASFMFHKAKLRGHVFRFSPALINKHYGIRDEGITGATLKLRILLGS
ncbi:hypothetical protein LIER_42204 [Lithospermum erythrorhizon]|uniref:Uncharacterized protein n=1 Tax=Lithospermum erythrorhizon TaxID=34254 RepID=A0AAV3RM09_LITER